MLTVTEIMKKIPHRYPFLLVDRIIEINREEKSIIGKKNVTINEDFFNGHFPEHPVMPGVLIVEGMAQCLGVLSMDGLEGKIPYFAAIESVKFRKPVVPGDTIIYEVRIDRMKIGIVKGSGVAKVNDEIVTEAKFTFSIADASL